jgi:hypothetical protein
MEILNDKQKAKYQEILKARLGPAPMLPATQPAATVTQ